MPSSVIAHIEYNAGRKRLTVAFVSGRIYQYVDVPGDVASSFQSAFSKGTFFNVFIRDRYDFKQLTPAH